MCLVKIANLILKTVFKSGMKVILVADIGLNDLQLQTAISAFPQYIFGSEFHERFQDFAKQSTTPKA